MSSKAASRCCSTTHPKCWGRSTAAVTGPLLAVALSTQGAHHGLLLLARDKESVRYARTDIEMGAVFGSHVALALELARVHRLREELLVFTDRDRIARDLHDLVIQRLFAAGLSVQSLTRFTKEDLALERIRNITGELDEAIRSLRDTIYSLKSNAGEIELLSGRIRRVTRSSSKSMPFPPRLTITGPVDAVTPDKADNVVAVVSEGLSNAIRHSGADTISVSVAVVKGRVTVVISDNGAGFAQPAKRNGLSNLEDRARMLDGECTITSAPDAGTSLEWSVPLLASTPRQVRFPRSLPRRCAGRITSAGSPDGGRRKCRAGDEDGGLRAAFESKLGQQRRHIVLDGLFRQEHFGGNLPVGQSAAHQLQDLAFLGREGGRARVDLFGLHQAVHDAGGHAFLEEGLARCCPPQGADQVRAADLLQHVSACARPGRRRAGPVRRRSSSG